MKKIVLNFLSLLILSLSSCSGENENKSITLKGPDDGAIIEILNDREKSYIDAMHNQEQNISAELKYCINDLGGDTIKIVDYYKPYTEGKGVSLDLEFSSSGFAWNASYYLHLADNKDFNNEIKILTNKKVINVNSLKSNTTYYWKVSDIDNNFYSSTKTFKTTLGWRCINAGAANNVRDLGGHIVKNNKIIKQGLIFRGCELNESEYDVDGSHHYKTINNDTLFTLKNVLKIGTEIDFRSASESNSITSSNLGWSIEYDRQSIGAYGSLLTDTSGKEDKKIKNIFKHFLEASEEKAIYYHCVGGADRTGTISFLLGGLLGMSYTDLIIDYELTSFSYNLREHDKIGEYSNFPSLIEGLKNVTDSKETNPDIQSMCEKYLINKVGLTNEDIISIKERMLENYHA